MNLSEAYKGYEAVDLLRKELSDRKINLSVSKRLLERDRKQFSLDKVTYKKKNSAKLDELRQKIANDKAILEQTKKVTSTISSKEIDSIIEKAAVYEKYEKFFKSKSSFMNGDSGKDAADSIKEAREAARIQREIIKNKRDKLIAQNPSLIKK